MYDAYLNVTLLIFLKVAVMQVNIICTKNKVPKQRDLISATLCMDSAWYKIETMQCFITVYMHAELEESVKLVLKS